MRLSFLAASLLMALAVVPIAQASPWPECPQCPLCPAPPPPRPYAPDACGPGFYCAGKCGMIYGPNYCVQPYGPPMQGFLPPPRMVVPNFPQARPGYGMPPGDGNGMTNSPLFPTHPWARSPRDYFMLEDY